mmetsp:Transcript_22056/g.46431  ORF Transcript_22056/g.46431 Transcript_22056/m.46431 type:complete len:687 (-) Transcript_22056:26-2086(-)
MASSIPSILGRKVLPVAVAATATSSGGDISWIVGEKSNACPHRSIFSKWGRFSNGLQTMTSCEAPQGQNETAGLEGGAPKGGVRPSGKLNPFLASGMRETVLRKRMTSIGRFSLKSETEGNLSIPTFFLALSGEKKKNATFSSSTTGPSTLFTGKRLFTMEDFEAAWIERGIPNRHPRFHSTVSAHDDSYFEETHHGVAERDENESSLQIKAELDRHASETMHYSVYREDLRNRLEHMLMTPIEVSDKLWEVKISNGLLGSSGAISRTKVDALLKAQKGAEMAAATLKAQLEQQDPALLRRRTTMGRIWKEVAEESENVLMESVLLFRSHHALADGASIIAALSDLSDEAEEIRAEIEKELQKWKVRGNKGPQKNAIQRVLARLFRLLKIWVWFTVGTLRAFMYQTYLQITTLRNPFDAVRLDAEKKGVVVNGRSISWCDAAPLEEVKKVAEIIGKARGGAKITINDLFVSCITSAVVRQLIEHEEFMAPMSSHNRKIVVPSINVVVPVHLRGGVILPNESMGNNIGAFVARVPGEMKHDAVGGGTCPTERLLSVHRSMLSSKKSPAPFVSYYLAKFCSDYLPENWTKSLFRRANANSCVVVSNIKGYHKKIHMNGMAIESAASFLPLPPGIPVGLVVQSYAGTISLSVTAEKWAVPDADKFLRWVLDEYQRLREEASKLENKEDP